MFFIPILLQVFISIIIMVGIYLALRPVILWYFKINETLKNQETQIELLQKLVQNTSITQTKSNGNPVVFNDAPIKLNEVQTMSVKYRKSKLQDGEIVVFNKETDKIETITNTQWQDILDNEVQNNYSLL